MNLNFAGAGTLVNFFAIILGGLLGLCGGNFLTEKMRQTLQNACAISVIFIGLSGTLNKMFATNDAEILLIMSLIGGGIFGEIIDIDEKFNRFGKFLKNLSGNQKDAKFVDAFVTASLTVCIGAMAIIGATTEFFTIQQF